MIECKRLSAAADKTTKKDECGIVPKLPLDALSVALRELRESAESRDGLLFDKKFDVFHAIGRTFVVARMCSFASQIGQPEIFEDLAQEFFLKIYNPKKILSYEPTRPAAAWISAVARNLVVDFARSKAGRERNVSFGSFKVNAEGEADGFEALIEDHRTEEPLQLVINEESRARLRGIVEESLKGLTDQDKHLLHILRDDSSYRETAELMGIPEGTVKSRMFKFRGIIRAKVTEAGLAPGQREED